MRRNLVGWLCATLAIVVLIPIALACSSSSNNNSIISNSSNTSNQKAANNATAPATSGQTNTNASSQSSSGQKLSDCDYAAKFQSATSALQTAANSLVSSTPVSGAAGALQLASKYGQVTAAAQQVVTQLKGVGLSSNDFKKVNDQIVSIYGDAGKQFADAEKAATSGDVNKASDTFNKAQSDVNAKVDKLKSDNKTVFDKIVSCNKK